MIKKLFLLFSGIKFYKESVQINFNFNKVNVPDESFYSQKIIDINKLNDFDYKVLNNKLNFDVSFRKVDLNNTQNIDFKKVSPLLIKTLKFTKKIFTLCFLILICFNACSISDGIEYSKIELENENGPQVFHITKIDKNSDLKLRVVLADFKLISRETVSNIAKKYNALGAVNAAYFAWTGQILGTVIMNHKIISLPIYKRSVFCINDDNSMFITVPDIKPFVEFENHQIEVGGINQKSYQNKIIVYTPEYGKNTQTQEHGIELTVINNVVVEIGSRNAIIPPNGFVIAVRDMDEIKKFEQLRLFDKINFKISLDSEMEKVRYAIGGGPNLLTDGEINVTHIEENFKPNLVNQRAPRTVLGFDFENNIYLITLDGRQKNYSVGMTLKEIAQWLKDYGLKNAMNLDGGGSSTLVIENEVKNRPSDGRERKINGALIIEKYKNTASGGNK